MIRQILLSLPSYPDRSPMQVLEGAATLAQLLGASLTAQIPQLSGDQKTWPPIIGAYPLDFPQLMNEAVVQSERNAASLTEDIGKACSSLRVPLDIRRSLANLIDSPDHLVDLARLHDLTIVPCSETDMLGGTVTEAVIFGTGRPTLLLPSGNGTRSLQWLDNVVVAWDYSREAARAMGDALPILAKAKKVHVLSVLGEKGIHTTCALGDLEKYLATHQVKYVLDEVLLKGITISDCVMSYAREVKADMLVMGAYGHSRLREFVLGGATRGALSNPKLPVFVSH
ncbi:MAG TPA: universal stress protein [Rhizomicrobium sp.]|nr:universal stress protein [Rhizomicrobium sp.]